LFSAADLLEVLRRRRTLKSIRPEVPGRMPPGWQAWLESIPVRAGAVSGAPSETFVGQLLERPLRKPPPRAPALNRWEAFSALWRQQWEPADPGERWLRILSMAGSVLVHACLLVVLAWLMYLHFLLLMSLPEPSGEAQVVQVTYIGRGTPDETGGGEVPPVQESPSETAQQAPAPSRRPMEVVAEPQLQATPRLDDLPVDVTAPQVAAQVPPLPQREIPTPALPEAAQPLQVTEVAVPDIDFVLPPTTTSVDTVQQPELAVPTREVPAPQPEEAAEVDLPSRLPTVAIEARDANPQIPALPTRDIPAPEAAAEARLPTREIATPATSAPELPGTVPDVAIAEIPMPSGLPSDAPGESDAEGSATEASDAAGATEVATTDSGQDAAGAGPERATAPGGWPSPVRGDDWDDALQDRDGASSGGLFDETGRPRLAGTGDGGPPGAAPPGSEAREAIDLEKGGTWLRRPPFDYTPTRFDRFWIPDGSLLEEWVRRGIKQMSIPIPGTSREIVCVVSMLQLGGGCMLNDEDINDEPSSGREAPEVPFKPELHEDQGALGRPPGG